MIQAENGIFQVKGILFGDFYESVSLLTVTAPTEGVGETSLPLQRGGNLSPLTPSFIEVAFEDADEVLLLEQPVEVGHETFLRASVELWPCAPRRAVAPWCSRP